jgi:hypothetical protein
VFVSIACLSAPTQGQHSHSSHIQLYRQLVTPELTCQAGSKLISFMKAIPMAALLMLMLIPGQLRCTPHKTQVAANKMAKGKHCLFGKHVCASALRSACNPGPPAPTQVLET